MATDSPNQEPDHRIFWPRSVVPGSLVVVGTAQQAEAVYFAEQSATRSVYTVRAIISDHIPLFGSIPELVKEPARCAIGLNENPLTIYLHHGGTAAVFFDLCADDLGRLSDIRVEVETGAPLTAFEAARTAVNELLDTLLRRVWMPLLIARLDLFDASDRLLAHQLHLPFPAELRVGPLGGIHQHRQLSELEALAREGICSSSPFYRLLCAHRLYDGTATLRTWLRKTAKSQKIEAALPKDLAVDHDVLEGLGFPDEARAGVRTVGDLHSSLVEMRNQAAHFVTREAAGSPLHVSDGRTYVIFSIASAALLHYAFLTLRELSMFFSANIEAHLLKGTVLPLKEHRSRFRVSVP